MNEGVGEERFLTRAERGQREGSKVRLGISDWRGVGIEWRGGGGWARM